MSSEQNQEAAATCVPQLCANNCGFYGNPTNMNYCSKCYREYIIQNNKNENTVIKNGFKVKNNSELCCNNNDESKSQMLNSNDDDILNHDSNNDHTDIKSTNEASTINNHHQLYEKNISINPIDCLSIDSNQNNDNHSKYDSNTPLFQSLDLLNTDLSKDDRDVVQSNYVETNNNDKDNTNKPIQIQLNRCWLCNKKVGLLGFPCRCGYTYCYQHRHFDTHNCDFDFKTYERELLKKQNYKVIAQKLEKL